MLFRSAYQLQTFLLGVFDYFHSTWIWDEGKQDKEQNAESKIVWKFQKKKLEINKVHYLVLEFMCSVIFKTECNPVPAAQEKSAQRTCVS